MGNISIQRRKNNCSNSLLTVQAYNNFIIVSDEKINMVVFN